MYLINNEPDAGALLTKLAGSIQDFNESVDLYLNHMKEYEVFNPFRGDVRGSSMGIDKPIPNRFWERLGIRHLVLNAYHSRPEAPEHWHVEIDEERGTAYGWNDIKNDEILEELKALFSRSSIVQFADWANVDGASNFWDGIFYDVIEPLDKRNFEFVFHLGDISKRFVFEVDEILGIIGQYSDYGRVTLVLDNNEADKLWGKLNGIVHDEAVSATRLYGARERYSYIFNTINVDTLVVLYSNRATLFSRGEQSQFGGRSFENIYIPRYGKDFFDAGYRLGMLLQLETAHCIALGQVVSGAYVKNEGWPGSKVLLTYIEDWIEEMSSDR